MNKQTMSGDVLALNRRCADLIGAISIMRHRHRKRKPMQKLLVKVRTQQLRAELRHERQVGKVA